MPVVNRENITMQVDQLQPYPKNARTHSDYQIKQLANFIKQVGYIDPIIIDESDMILAGHGRALAALRADINSVPCVRIAGLTDSEKRAYIIADNKLALNAGWDDDLLKAELDDLLAIGDIDISSLGFSDNDLSLLDVVFSDGYAIADYGFDSSEYDKPQSTDEQDAIEDNVPEVEQNVYGVERGDIWQLGKHRLMCGDSTSESDVAKLMDGNKADMVFTDPPYNVASDSKNFAADVSKSMNDLKNSDWDKNFKIETALDRLKDSISENVTMYIWTSHFLINDICKHLKDFGYTNYLIWSKPNPMPSLSKRHPAWNTELCVYASRGSKRVVNYPSQGHFLSCREVIKKSDGTHPTQKPLELITPLIEFSSNQGQMILDLFLGSGSTLIACEKTGRKCYGMELDPHYCSVIIKRYEDYSNGKAVKL